MIFLLALRNILRNKRNSLSIVLLIGTITALFFIGNSVTGNGSRGLRRTFVDNMTGDILIEEKGEVTMNLFGANTPVIEDYFSVPVLASHSAIRALLDGRSEIEGYSSQVSGAALLEIAGIREAAPLCGIDGGSYFGIFPGISLVDGRFLQSGEFGAMISEEKAASIASRTGQKPQVGDVLTLTAAGDSGFKIREAPLVGIFRYKNPVAYMNEVVLVDAQTVRVLSEIQIATSDALAADEALSLLGQGAKLDDLFGGSGFGVQGSGVGEEGLLDELSGLLAGNTERLNIGDRGQGTGDSEDGGGATHGGDWNFIVVRLKAGESAERFIKKTRGLLAANGAMAVGWRFAAGSQAIVALLVQALFNAGVLLVSIACVLAVVNILLIAVFKRTREIGTLRAIGARDGYIRALILGENCGLGLLAGFLGVALGWALFAFVNGAKIPVSNEILASILGGAVVNIAFSPPLAALSLLTALVLGLISSLYPVEIAVKIDPIVAVQAG
jgi:putative ABC transport system permease protein